VNAAALFPAAHAPAAGLPPAGVPPVEADAGAVNREPPVVPVVAPPNPPRGTLMLGPKAPMAAPDSRSEDRPSDLAPIWAE
jgi:hypothetical protein